MQFLLSLFLAVTTMTFAFAQETSTIYLDKYRFPTENKAEAATYMKVQVDDAGLYRVSEFYLTDTLKSKGTFSDKWLFSKEDSLVTYYADGKIESAIFYKNNMADGAARYWYRNGQLKEVRTHDRLNIQVKEFYDSLGKPMVLNGRGSYILEERDSEGKTRLTLVGPVSNGYKNGSFTGYLPDGSIFCKEQYHNDQLVSGVSYSNGQEIHYESFIGGDFYQRWMKHIMKNLRYPHHGVEGTVYVKLLLAKDYSVQNAVVVKGFSKAFDKEAVRVMKDTGFKFGPMIRRGQLYEDPVFLTPLKFKSN